MSSPSHVALLTPTHSVILGRTIKNEYLTLGTLFTVGATVFALKGGNKDASRPLSERVRDAAPIKAESRCVLPFFSHGHALMHIPARKKSCKCAVYIVRVALYDV